MSIKYVVMLCLLLLHHEASSKECSQLPNPINPSKCCRFPTLFKQNVYEYCRGELKKSKQCFFDCVFTATEIRRKGIFSLSKAYDYVDWVMERDNPFSSIYRKAFEKCITEINAAEEKLTFSLNNGLCSFLPEIAFLCIQNQMLTECPTNLWNQDISDCNENRDFILNCMARSSV